jgi:hypothetical protein
MYGPTGGIGPPGWSAPPPDEAALRDEAKTLVPLTAEQLYRTALAAAPGWAGGHFNPPADGFENRGVLHDRVNSR